MPRSWQCVYKNGLYLHFYLARLLGGKYGRPCGEPAATLEYHTGKTKRTGRIAMQADVAIVGAGPSGIFTALSSYASARSFTSSWLRRACPSKSAHAPKRVQAAAFSAARAASPRGFLGPAHSRMASCLSSHEVAAIFPSSLGATLPKRPSTKSMASILRLVPMSTSRGSMRRNLYVRFACERSKPDLNSSTAPSGTSEPRKPRKSMGESSGTSLTEA